MSSEVEDEDSRVPNIAAMWQSGGSLPTLPRRERAPREEPPAPVAEPDPGEQVDQAPRSNTRAARQRPNATAATRPRVGMMLPFDLHAELRRRSIQERVSFRAMIFRAVELAYNDEAFELLLAEHRKLQVPVEEVGGLFGGSEAPKAEPLPRVQIEIKPEHQHLATLDRLRKQVGAKDRTEFVVVALTYYFAKAGAGE